MILKIVTKYSFINSLGINSRVYPEIEYMQSELEVSGPTVSPRSTYDASQPGS